MTNYVVLSLTDHVTAHWLPRSGYSFAKEQQVTPVLLAELGKLLPQYAMGFLKTEDNFQAVALTGLGDGRNVYLGADGLWLSAYVPATLRGYPFALMDRGNGEKVLCIEETHLLENQKPEHLNGLSLFDEKTELTAAAAELLNLLNQCEHNRALTDTACQKLADAGLMEPWVIQLNRGEENVPTEIGGVYRINEELLNTLDAQVFADLREGGALSLAYAQLFSMSQIQQLNLRDKYQDQQIKSAPPNEMSGMLEDGGVLNFDSFTSGASNGTDNTID
jgi:hypothetical protein